jgi:hypothetical protein
MLHAHAMWIDAVIPRGWIVSPTLTQSSIHPLIHYYLDHLWTSWKGFSQTLIHYHHFSSSSPAYVSWSFKSPWTPCGEQSHHQYACWILDFSASVKIDHVVLRCPLLGGTSRLDRGNIRVHYYFTSSFCISLYKQICYRVILMILYIEDIGGVVVLTCPIEMWVLVLDDYL